METSMTHRDKIVTLNEYGQRHPNAIVKINGVKVCFRDEFCIGKGSNASVYIGLADDGCEKAVKRILKSTSRELDSNEKEILNSSNTVNSKRVVDYWYYDEESDSTFSYLILCLLEETLKQYVETHSQQTLKASAPFIIHQVLEGLNDLHREPKPILHRDVKPSNIMRDVHGKWLLIDFDVSRKLNDGQTTHVEEVMETTKWTAFESYKGKHKKQSDIQAVGMVMFYILTNGQHPFGLKSSDRLDNLRHENPVGLVHLKDDPMAKDLISWMLKQDAEDRPYADEALTHPYLQPADQQFEFLKCVANEPEIMMGDTTCDVVNEINYHSLLRTIQWKSQVYVHMPGYVFGKRPYGNEWSECLRFIRNTFMHWYERPRSIETTQNMLGEPEEYFLKMFPTLVIVAYRVMRSKENWKTRTALKKFFPERYQDQRSKTNSNISSDDDDE